MKKTDNKEKKWRSRKWSKLQNSVKKRTTFAKEFRKKFVPIFLSLTLILTSFMYVMYRQVISNAEKAFENSLEDMKKDFDDCYMYIVNERGEIWDEQTMQDFERYLSIAMNNHGTTGRVPGSDDGLMLKDNFSDFASNLYVEELGEHGMTYKQVKGTEDFVFLLEQRGNASYIEPKNIHRIYACPVEDIQEAYDFEMENRQRNPKNPILSISGFSNMHSFYINYTDGTFTPEQIDLYKLNYVKEHQYGGGYAEYSQEELVKELHYNPTNVEKYEYINFYTDPYYTENFDKLDRFFSMIYYTGSKAGGPADTVLQKQVNRFMDKFDSLTQYIGNDSSHHGLVLEFSCCSNITFNATDYKLWVNKPEATDDTDTSITDTSEDTYYGLSGQSLLFDPAHPEFGYIAENGTVAYYIPENTENPEGGNATWTTTITDADTSDIELYQYTSVNGSSENTLSLTKESYDTDIQFHPPSDFNHSYIVCMAATMDLRELYGTKVIIYYLSMLLISLLAAFLLARRSYAKLSLQYQMMDYRKALTDSMAHDLKSPLMAISGYAENLKENVYTNQKDIYADKILENIEYMNHIVSDVLELSKAESENTDISLEIIDTKALFENLFEKYADSMAEKDISSELQGELKLKADSRMMERVIDNLICNAVTHGINGCTIEVSLEKTGFTIKNSFDEESIDAEFLSTKAKKALIGKHPNQKKTFNSLVKPFVKGNKNRTNHQGSGLGLAIAKELLEAQGYKLLISVEEGTFTVIVK